MLVCGGCGVVHMSVQESSTAEISRMRFMDVFVNGPFPSGVLAVTVLPCHLLNSFSLCS